MGLEFDPELMEWDGVRATGGCFSAEFSRKCQYHVFYHGEIATCHHLIRRKVDSVNGETYVKSNGPGWLVDAVAA